MVAGDVNEIRQVNEIRRFPPGRSMKVAAYVGVMLWAILFVGLVALVLLGKASGATSALESVLFSLGFGTDTAEPSLQFLPVVPWLGVLGGIFVASLVIFAGFTSLVYNAVAEITGGVQFHSKQRDTLR